MFRTLESEIGLYETDYIFVSSGYPPRVKVGWTSWIFLRSQLPGLTGFVSAPEVLLTSYSFEAPSILLYNIKIFQISSGRHCIAIIEIENVSCDIFCNFEVRLQIAFSPLILILITKIYPAGYQKKLK